MTRTGRSTLLTAAAALAVSGALMSAPPAGAADTASAEVSPHAAQRIDNIGASGAWWVLSSTRMAAAVRPSPVPGRAT